MTSEDITGAISVKVEGLGYSGDGFVKYNEEKFFIPNTLPDETLKIRFSGSRPELIEILEPSQNRVSPVCNLFNTCGGCALQHMSLPALLDWKTSKVANALNGAGFSNLPQPNQYQTSPKTRRRMDFAIQRIPGNIILGLHRRNGDPVDMQECQLLDERLFNLLPDLREMLSHLGAITGRASLVINLFDSGADFTLSTSAALSASDRMKIADFTQKHHIPRFSWQDPKNHIIETVAQTQSVRHTFQSGVASPPPSAFLQATPDAEEKIVESVLSGLPALNRKDIITELFAGCGTLTFPLSEKGRVIAFEGESQAASCLKQASGGKRIESHNRDLMRRPLLPHDLKSTRVVVLDPPYGGASAQMLPLSKSTVSDIVYISCNPTALEKDAAVLKKAGFSVIDWSVIDQFLWSTEVESVITFSRDQKRIKRENSRRTHSAPSH
ncbi:class I SAM-dependent RNA methyltransferase [Swingsia samuiensis]|nr:class I SAM-dependent RNA methyltransferase [Swingsia samuiensis]